MTLSTEDRSLTAAAAARHSAATLRALNASRELAMLLKGCEATVRRAKTDVDEEALEIVERISRALTAAGESAEQLLQRVQESAHERSGFWEPATDPYASIRRSLARRVQNLG
jgi:Ser-tRNA(Ala) deacylase AlaX